MLQQRRHGTLCYEPLCQPEADLIHILGGQKLEFGVCEPHSGLAERDWENIQTTAETDVSRMRSWKQQTLPVWRQGEVDLQKVLRPQRLGEHGEVRKESGLGSLG